MERLRRFAVLVLTGCTACASLHQSESADVPQIAFTGAPKLATPPATPTVSSALDRISKRRPELDGVARRSGTGHGVTIYVFDGGIDPRHPELAGRVRIGFDAYPSAPRVCNPHGTAVAGAAAGRNLGVAPDADVVDIKIINCLTMHGSEEAVLAAARWVVADRREHGSGPAVANWSFVIGMTTDVPALDKAIGVLEDAGILVVVSAGNYDRDACKIAPGNSRLALVVGASAIQPAGRDSVADVRVSGTAWGPCVDVYAPGDDVLLPNYVEDQPTLGMWSGTSMSAGYVSGAAALMLERIPSAAPASLASIIRRRATADVVKMRRDDSNGIRGRLVYIGPEP